MKVKSAIFRRVAFFRQLTAVVLAVGAASVFSTGAAAVTTTTPTPPPPTMQPTTLTASPTPIPGGCDAPALNIVATIGMIADVVSEIGGSCVQVTAIMGPGVDPHLYSATPSDVDLLFEADLIFYNGLNLEARMVDILEQLETGMGTPVIAVGEAIPADQILFENNTETPDPHVWMDVSLWQFVAEAIRDGLIAQLPQNQMYLEMTTAAYIEEMQATDVYIAEQIASVPEAQRVLVTAHDAFQYFSRRYQIEVYAPQGITTQAEVGVADIRATIDLLVERQIPAVFIETSISPDVIEAIQSGAQARALNVRIGGQLYSDAMGNAGTPEGTYLGMIRANADIIVAGLLGQTAEEEVSP